MNNSHLFREKKVCKWWTESHIDLDDQYFTSCDNSQIISSLGPEHETFKYCPYCGGEIELEVSDE